MALYRCSNEGALSGYLATFNTLNSSGSMFTIDAEWDVSKYKTLEYSIRTDLCNFDSLLYRKAASGTLYTLNTSTGTIDISDTSYILFEARYTVASTSGWKRGYFDFTLK